MQTQETAKTLDAKELGAILGLTLPQNGEVHFVVRSQEISEQPVGGRLKIVDGKICDSQLRTAMAGTVATSWPGTAIQKSV